MKDYLAVVEKNQTEIIIEKSRFITTITGIKDYNDAMNFINSVQKQYNTATHNCYAFISNSIGTEMRFSDDGEPQGTAGQPMLEVLKKRNLACTAVVVTRYFGGIKLGAGGLVSAYTKCVADACDKANIQKMRYSVVLKIDCSYNQYDLLKNFLMKFESVIIDTVFKNQVTLKVAVPMKKLDEFKGRVNNITLGQSDFKIIENKFMSYK